MPPESLKYWGLASSYYLFTSRLSLFCAEEALWWLFFGWPPDLTWSARWEPQFPKPHGTFEACPLVAPWRTWLYPFMSVQRPPLTWLLPSPPQVESPSVLSSKSLYRALSVLTLSSGWGVKGLPPLWTPFPSSFPALWAWHLYLPSLLGCSVSVVPSLIPTRRVSVLGVSITPTVWFFQTEVPPQQEQQQTDTHTESWAPGPTCWVRTRLILAFIWRASETSSKVAKLTEFS